MPIDIKNIDGVPYYLPATIGEVEQLVQMAIDTNKVVCMRGASHSIPLIPSLEKENNRLYIYLGRMRSVQINTQQSSVTVEGGCNLGYDPNDPMGISTLENSLTYQVHQAGLAFPDLGGITHQTVGGFLSTGASGSSLTTPFNSALQSITIVTAQGGTATTVVFSRANGPAHINEFFAAGLSLGLFGVIVKATFELVPSYIIRGSEEILKLSDWPVDFFGDEPTKMPLINFFNQNDFQRLLWWPQKGVNKIQVWKANSNPMPANFSPIPYEQMTGNILGIPLQLLGKWVLTFFGKISWLLQRSTLFKNTILGDLLQFVFRNFLLPLPLRMLVTSGIVRFKDTWYNGLPMDNSINERLIPVWLSEMWFPLDLGPQVHRELRDYFEKRHDGPGTFGYEIYLSGPSDFWISPGYGRPSIRMDIFWFAGNKQDPIKDFYDDFWKQLDEYGFRSHWGKFMPDHTYEELKALYPMFQSWLEVRNIYDPVNVFLNDYWRAKLHL